MRVDFTEKEAELIQIYANLFCLKADPDRILEEWERLCMEWACERKYESLVSGKIIFLTDEEKKLLNKQMEKTAEENVLADMVLEEIGKKVTVNVEELQQEAEKIAKRQNISLNEVYDFFGKDLSLLKKDLVAQKAILWMQEHLQLAESIL